MNVSNVNTREHVVPMHQPKGKSVISNTIVHTVIHFWKTYVLQCIQTIKRSVEHLIQDKNKQKKQFSFQTNRSDASVLKYMHFISNILMESYFSSFNLPHLVLVGEALKIRSRRKIIKETWKYGSDGCDIDFDCARGLLLLLIICPVQSDLKTWMY